MEILITSKTHKGKAACVGGLIINNNRLVRLLNPGNWDQYADTPFAIGDVWEMFRVVLEERKRREIDPALEMLRETVTELGQDTVTDVETMEKMQEMLDFFETATDLYEQVQQLSTETLVQIAKKRETIRKVLNLVTGS